MTWNLPYDAVAEHLGAQEADVRRVARQLGCASPSGITSVDLDRVAEALAAPTPAPLPIDSPTAEEIRARRQALGLGETAFAQRLGVGRLRVRQWEEGERRMTAGECALFADLAPRPTPKTQPVAGDAVGLHCIGLHAHLAVCGGLALAVRPDQLAADLTPPARLVLDRSLTWQPAPASLPEPLATYAVAGVGRFTLTLVCPDIVAPEEVPDLPRDVFRLFQPPRSTVAPVAERAAPMKITYVEKDRVPAPKVNGRGLVAQAAEHIRGALASNKAICIAFAPDERSNAALYRYRAAAKSLDLACALVVAEWRPYTSKSGTERTEPAILYVVASERPKVLAAPAESLRRSG